MNKNKVNECELFNSSNFNNLPEHLYISNIISKISNKNIVIKSFPLLKAFSSHSLKEMGNFPHQMMYISQSSKLYISFTKDDLTISLIYLVLFVLKRKKPEQNTMIFFLNQIVRKLYLSKVLSLDNINLLIKCVLFFSLSPIVDPNDDGRDFNLKTLKAPNVFKMAIEFICLIDVPSLTFDICDFINKNMLINKSNKYLIANDDKLLDLLYLKDTDNKNIIHFISEVLSFKSGRKLIENFIGKIKEIVNVNSYSNKSELISIFSRQIALMYTLDQIENKEINKDPFILTRGFVMNHSSNNGITVNNIPLDKEMTILFSFKFSPISNKQKPRYPILYLMYEVENSNKIFGVYIDQNHLFTKLNDKLPSDLCEITPNETYTAYFQIQNEIYFLHIATRDDFFKFTTGDFPKIGGNSFNLFIGRFAQDNFEGYIGEIFIFKTIFTVEFQENFFRLQGDYGKIYYFTHFANTVDADKYERNLGRLPDDVMESNNDFATAKEFFEKNKELSSQLVASIRPLYSSSKQEKKTYNHMSIKLMFFTHPKVEKNDTFFFETHFFAFEFVKYDGFYFIILILEHLTNIFNDNTICEKGAMLFCDIIKFIIEVFFQLRIEQFEPEIKKLLFSIWKCLSKVYNYLLFIVM